MLLVPLHVQQVYPNYILQRPALLFELGLLVVEDSSRATFLYPSPTR